MAKLYAPNGAVIIGTVETIPNCTATFSDVSRDAEGRLELVYCGGTNVNWDAQFTTRDARGYRLFFDDDYNTWPEDVLELREEDTAAVVSVQASDGASGD